MKPIHIIIGLLFFNLSITSYAQISVFDIVEDAKKERGDATDAAEEDADAKAMEGMQEFFGETTGMKYTGDKPMVGRCLDVMGDHAYKLAELQDQIEKTDDCKKKKELLEYQALLLLTAGTKFFCPDELNSDKIRYGREIIEYLRPLTQIFIEFTDLMSEEKEIEDLDGQIDEEEFKELKRKFQKKANKFWEKVEEISNSSSEIGDLTKTFLKFKYADDKFGNRWSTRTYITKCLFVIDKIEKNDLSSKFSAFIVTIDYFTYFLSPEFMAKRAGEIAAVKKSLPCN